MKLAHGFALITLAVLAQSAQAQRSDPVNSLARAKATFGAADSDNNGKVTAAEFARQKLNISKAEFDAMDVDKDGSWSRDEFVVYYRRLLLNGGQRAAPDLESEVARIQGLRRAKEEEEAAKRPVVAPKAETPPATDITTRLRAAIDDLEKKAALRQATREDFQRVRDALIDRAKIVTAQDPVGGAGLVTQFEAAVDALEGSARAGKYSREEYSSLRESLIVRGRDAAKPRPAAGTTASAADENALQTALDRALDDLIRKAEARQATREDYARVKETFIARARGAVPSANPTAVAERGTLEQLFSKAIDKLEADGRAGRFSREEFHSVRDSYVSRVRAIADSGAPAAPAPATSTNPNDLAAKLDLALDELSQKAAARQATRDDFDRVRNAMTARARAVASANPAVAERQSTIDELFLNAMTKLEADTLAGKFSPEEFQNLREGYFSRARAIMGSGPPPVAQPAPGAPSVAPPDVPAAAPASIEQRFDMALAELQRKAIARGATRADYQGVNDLLAARARAAVQLQAGAPVAETDPRVATLASSLQSALARLENAQAAGGVSAADFANLRQILLGRVREAAKPVAGPAEGRGAIDTTPKREEVPPVEPKRGEAVRGEPKPIDPAPPVEPPKPADDPAARGRTRPVTEPPKPVVDPPKPTERPQPEERPKPSEPPHEDARGTTGRPGVPPRGR